MANLRASRTTPLLSKGFPKLLLHTSQFSPHTSKSIKQATLSKHRVHFLESAKECKIGARGRRALVCWSAAKEVSLLGEGESRRCGVDQGQEGYLVREFGWGVRRMVEVGEEMRRVAYVQAEAFHVPVTLFNDFFFKFFEAEVLSALMYRLGNSPPDRYACLVAESINVSDLLRAPEHRLVGVVDVTVQRDEEVLRHLEGVEEYLYVSGMAVLKKFRRQKVATMLLKACDALSLLWGYRYLALRAYEDDSAAQKLYSKAGYKVVSGDPYWISWIGKKRRILMIKPSVMHKTS
ncbi:GCN5-related N-acetyltransferase 10, chloroplastic isoform X1 [Elaeis guineensis]|uniref:GCN5-related N-acetyltransferase 10, chloroplastic isoform X1 n=1 Tax=Elaeis guineensis var. tenera TaxID=51953 RepID=UPI003C6CE991